MERLLHASPVSLVLRSYPLAKTRILDFSTTRGFCAFIENFIIPYTTHFHWNLPLALYYQYADILLNSESALDFAQYAEVCI